MATTFYKDVFIQVAYSTLRYRIIGKVRNNSNMQHVRCQTWDESHPIHHTDTLFDLNFLLC